MSVWREQPIRKKILIITAFAVIMLTIFKVDDWQQKRYALVRDGYQQMSQGEYQKAEEEFSQYLDGVSFPLYWKLQYLVNRDETSYENVRNISGTKNRVKQIFATPQGTYLIRLNMNRRNCHEIHCD